MTLCRGCGHAMEVVEENFFFHPACIPEFTPVPGMRGMSPYDLEIREDVIELVRWTAANSHRSKQLELGCSEVGHPCDRRLAYRIAGVEPGGYSNDPWPAVVGTAVHSWMEEAVRLFQEAHGLDHWITEMEVLPSPLVKGHTDLYDARRKLVLDWKFPSPDNLRKMREDGPSGQYRIQVMLYGLGHLNAGRPVERVGIVAAGRQGWLKDLYVWTTEFDRSVAQGALDRVHRIGGVLLQASSLEDASLWQSIAAEPSRLCTWCPFHRRDFKIANEKGCPGK